MKSTQSVPLLAIIIAASSLISAQNDCFATTSGNATITVVGLQGESGSRGPVGPQGPQGIRGWRGEKGEKGVIGEVGKNGTKGEVGIGLQGNTGLPGPIGPRGYRGPDGERGQFGLPGPIGPRGYRGPDGERGPSGGPGPPGVRGQQGPPGEVHLTDVQYKKMQEEVSNDIKQILQCELPSSCKELLRCKNATPSGYYNIWTPQGVEKVYCEMNTANCGNITGGWMRVAYIDMTNRSNNESYHPPCPHGLNYTINGPTHMCARLQTTPGCTSVIFPTHKLPFTKVCGRAHGYQYFDTTAFYGYHNGQPLDGYYVSGLSVTSGSPREHIWTFAAGRTNRNTGSANCPCHGQEYYLPSFVGDEYFCESSASSYYYASQRWYMDNPLWDSRGCNRWYSCCNRGGPWFSISQREEVSDNIEVRWCGYDAYGGSNIGVDQLEIYIY